MGANMLPGFFVAQGSDAIAEWDAFQTANPDAGADALADLDWLGDQGPSSIRDEDRDRMGMADLYCRQEGGWGVFYTILGPDQGRWRVTVLMVVSFEATHVDQAA